MPFTQDTVYLLPGAWPADEAPNKTFGRSLRFDYSPLSSQTSALDEVLVAASHLPQGDQRDQVVEVVDLVRQSLLRWKAVGKPITLSVHWSVVPDGALILQWASPLFRLGFNLEENRQESSWILVTAPELGGQILSGPLLNNEIQDLVSGMTRFVADNS